MDRGCGCGYKCGCGCGRLSWKEVAVFLCACLNNGLAFMVVMGLNTLFTDWQASFHSDRGSTASVQAICLGVLAGGGLVAGMLERKLGQRRSMLLGSFLFSAGFFAGGFAESLPVLILCVGVIAGSGISLVNLSNLSATLQRFPRRAGFVASMVGLAATLALLASPFCVRYLTDTYTWRGCLLLAGGINLHSFLFSLLLTSPLLQTAKTPGAHSTAVSPLLQASEQQESEDMKASLQNSSCHRRHQEERPDLHADEETLGAGVGQRTSSCRCYPSSGSALLSDDTKERMCDDLHSNARSGNDNAEVSYSHNHRRSLDSFTEDAAATDYSGKNSDPIQDLTRLPNDTVTCSIPVLPDVVASQSEHRQTPTAKNSFLGENECKRVDKLKTGPEKDGKNMLKMQQKNIHIYQDPNESVGLETETDSEGHEVSPTLKSNHCCEDAGQSDSRLEERCRNRGQGRLRKWTRQLHFLTRPLYLAVILSTTLKVGMGNAFLFLILDYTTSQHWSLSDGLFLNFIFMTFNLVACVLAVVICLQPKDCSIGLSMAGGVIGGVALCVLGQVRDFTLAACAVAGLATAYSWGISMYSPCVLRAAGGKDYPLALGMCLTLVGVGIVAFTRLAGFLVDLQESYTPVTLIYGIAMFLAEGNLFFFSRCHQNTPAAVFPTP